MRECEQALCRWWTGEGCACDLMGLTSSGDFTEARYHLARLTAVADAARVFHAKGPDYWDDGKGDPEWLALGAALDALDGGDRG